METIVIVLFILATLSFLLQIELIKKRWIMVGWLVVIGVFIYIMHTYAIEQSYKAFINTLQNTSLMMNFVVLQVIEALGGILISVFLIRSHYNEPVNKFFKYFIYLPRIIVFPAVFYFESFVFLQMPGINFKIVGILVAIFIPMAIFLLKNLFSYGVPEFTLQVELKFIIHLIQLIAAVWLSVLLFRLPVTQVKSNIDAINAMIVMLMLILAGLVFGFLWYRIRIKRMSKKINGHTKGFFYA